MQYKMMSRYKIKYEQQSIPLAVPVKYFFHLKNE